MTILVFIAGVIVGVLVMICWGICVAAGRAGRMEEQYHWNPQEQYDREEK